MTKEPFIATLAARWRQFTSKRVVRFGFVGVTVALFFAGLNALFGKEFGFPPQLAFFIAYPPALALHFLLNKLWTFGDRSATTHIQLGEYVFSVVVTFLIQWPSFELLQKVLNLPGWAAALGANLLQMSASFALLRWRVFHGAAEGRVQPASNPWHRIAILAIVAGGLAFIYWTAVGVWEAPHFQKSERDYYNLLVAGFRKGSLAMDVAVPEALKHAENPWDPAKRPAGIVLHDASYYNGHYYFYFGVVPAVLLFWPFHALTGYDLPYVLATVFYLSGAFLISTWLWLKILETHFKQASLLMKLTGPLVLGLCAGQAPLARRASIWEMPIGAGHFFCVCLVASSYFALRARRPWACLAAAGLSLGLAIGCRPTLVAAGPALAFLVLKTGWIGTGFRSKAGRFLKSFLSAAIPFASVVSSLLVYNFRRFGNLLEFGLNYQLSASYEAKAHHFLLGFAPFNLGAYFFWTPQWGRYFPFLHPHSWVARPLGYYGIEFVYGALVVCPVVWGAALSAGILFRRRNSTEAALVAFLVTMAAGTTALLSCFNTAAARYVPDFLPWWLWLALLGWAWLEAVIGGWRPRRQILRKGFLAVYGLLVFASMALAFVQSAALHGIMANRTPDTYRRVSRVFDFPAAAWERLSHERSGPISMDVTFPEFKTVGLEPLLVTGVEYEADYFFVYYKAPHVVRIGYANSGDAPIYSADIPVESGRRYHFRFEGGSIYPPEAHPIYTGWTEGQLKATKGWVRISMDGRPILNQPTPFHEGAPEFLQIGADRRSAAFGRRFTGVISSVQREALVPSPEVAHSSGDVILKVSLPDEIVPASQPLLVAGRTGSAELIGYRPVDESHFVLTYEKWGGGYWESDPIVIPKAREATFRIRLGSLLSSTGPFPQGLYKDLLIVWMNGQPVWWRHAFGSIGADPPVEVMANTIGSSAMRGSFQGNLEALSREPIPEWKDGAFRALELDLAGRGAGIEPLAVTGVTGRADLLAIEWLPGNKARLLLDHWSHAGFSSRDFDWGPEQMHHLKVTLPSFAALDDPAIASGTGKLSVEVDGVLIWEEWVPFYGARSVTFSFGRNSVGSSVALPALQCRLGDIRQDFGDK